MARVATLIGKDKFGNWSSLGIAEENDIQQLVEAYCKLREIGGVIKKGKGEVKLSEMRLLCNNTAGGELKARQLFS